MEGAGEGVGWDGSESESESESDEIERGFLGAGVVGLEGSTTSLWGGFV